VLITLSVVWAALIAWLIMRAVTQYGAYEIIGPENAPSPSPRSDVALIVPARNEEVNIRRCVESLATQDYPREHLRLIVVDDNSTDATPMILHELQERLPHLNVLPGQPLAQGWKGKPYACAQAAEQANSLFGGTPPQWLCFMDADTWAAPELVGCAVAVAEARAIDMLSFEPMQVLGSFWERLVIPAGLFMMAFGHDLRKVNDPARPDAVANGQFILMRQSVYERIGGHAAVREELSEDSALARLVKGSGHRLAVLGTRDLLWARMYRGLTSLWEGVSKNVLDMVGGAWPMLGFAAAGIILAIATIALPLWGWLAFAHGHESIELVGAIVATCASASIMGMHIGGACYFKIPWWYGALFPVGYVMGAATGVNGVLLWARGSIAWKGRVYLPPTRAAAPDVAKPRGEGLQW
jgi:chlorobactene glucosyltransferase